MGEPAGRAALQGLAFLIDSFAIGGTELNAFRTARALVERGVVPRVYHLQEDGPLLDEYRSLHLPLIRVPMGSFRYARSWWRMRVLGRRLRQDGVNLIHTHDVYTNIVGAGSVWGSGSPALIASRRWWLATPHPGLRRLNRWSYGRAGAILANSARVAELVRSEVPRLASRVRVIPNFLEPAAFQQIPGDARATWRQAVGLPATSPVVGIVARLAPVKNHAVLFEAFAVVAARLPTVRLALVGEGPEEVVLRRLAATLGMTERVHFLGALPNRPNLHQLFDVSVLCSTSEGFPNSLIEAMAVARPVVATDVGGVRDAVRDGDTGVVVPTGASAPLAEAILRLLSAPEEASTMGARGCAVALESFSEVSVIAALMRVYHDAIREARR